MVTKKDNIPTNLGLKIATDEGKAWTDIRDSASKEILINKRHILINEKIVKLAGKMILEEEEKLK